MICVQRMVITLRVLLEVEREHKILNKLNTLLASSLLYEVDGSAQISLKGMLGI